MLQKLSIPKTEDGKINLSVSQVKSLEGLAAQEHLSQLHQRTSNLITILRREEEGFFIPYMDSLEHALEALAFKYQIEGLDKVDFPLTISSLDCGFPTETAFILLEKDEQEAQDILSTLPNKEEIISRMQNCLRKSSSIANLQVLLKRLNFYKSLSENSILKTYSLSPPIRENEKNGLRYYTLNWNCIERLTKLPTFYRLYLTQNRDRTPLEQTDNPLLETIIYQTQQGGLSLNAIGRLIDDNLEETHPKILYRYKVGPFYNENTENSPEMQSLLKGSGESVLKFTVEKVHSERTKNHYVSWFDRFRGKKDVREVFSPVDYDTRIIAPFKLKQKLRNRDEYGKSCKVYAVTEEGEVIG